MYALYIHIPFCSRICSYCDFVKEVAGEDKKDAYTEALCHEIVHHKAEYGELRTIHLGGGTPSSLSLDNLHKILGTLTSHIDITGLKEFGVECNPADITPVFARLLSHHGVNRISLGAQTFNDKHLRTLNRDHDGRTIREAVRILKDAGFINISIDLLFALPEQTTEELLNDLEAALALKIPHISYYSLILEPGTRLHTLYKKGTLELLDEDTESEMYLQLIDTLTGAGYGHYEISNFARPGHESSHNSAVWEDRDYRGLGAAAHSKLANRRHYNEKRAKDYITQVEKSGRPTHYDYPYEEPRDYLLMGLRLLSGIDLAAFEKRFSKPLLILYPELARKVEEGLLEIADGHLRFTKAGLLLGNEIFALL